MRLLLVLTLHQQDPSEKLEELRRHSLILTQSDLTMPAGRKIPDRGMPDSAVEVPEQSSPVKEDVNKLELASPQPTRPGRVQFGAVNFGQDDQEDDKRETVLSPTDASP